MLNYNDYNKINNNINYNVQNKNENKVKIWQNSLKNVILEHNGFGFFLYFILYFDSNLKQLLNYFTILFIYIEFNMEFENKITNQ